MPWGRLIGARCGDAAMTETDALSRSMPKRLNASASVMVASPQRAPISRPRGIFFNLGAFGLNRHWDTSRKVLSTVRGNTGVSRGSEASMPEFKSI